MKAATREKDLLSLRKELGAIATDGLLVWQRQQRAREVRFCEWAGQSADGRRHADDLGETALPFEGAPDSRIPLVDAVINEKVATGTQAFFRAQVQAAPVETSDTGEATATSTLLRWLRDRELREELQVEVELSAQYLYGDDPGLVIVETTWRQDVMLTMRDLSFEQIALLYVTGESNPDNIAPDDPRLDPAVLADFQDLMINPDRTVERQDWFASIFPGVEPSALRKAIRELARSGAAQLPVPVVRTNRPTVQTLRYMEDIFFPVGTADIQRARSIHRREWISEVELRERMATMGWPRQTVEAIIAKGPGRSLITTSDYRRGYSDGTSNGEASYITDERNFLYEIWWSYDRRANEMGMPGIYVTTWSDALPGGQGTLTSELLAYDHGEYPFVLRTRERLGREVTESRGITVPIATHQTEIKGQRDARGAYTQLVACPPKKVRMRRGAAQLIIGPDAEIPVMQMDDFEYLSPPQQLPAASIEMERTTKTEVNEYVGRMTLEGDPNRIAILQQHEVDNFFGLWRAVFGQVLALCQQYYTPTELARVTGAPGEMPGIDPQAIRGGWDVIIEIDARDLNMDFAMKKMDAYTKALSLDSSGSQDRTIFAEWAVQSIDPILARRSNRPAGVVQKKVFDEAQNNVAKMAAGIEPPMNPDGVINPQLQQQLMQQTVQQSPKLMQQYAADENFRELFNNYQKFLNQQVMQDQNKVIGRLGTTPLQGGGLQAAG